jgi:hypothetical protein
MKYRHKGSGKTYSEDEMAKMRKAQGYKAEDYESYNGDDDDDDEESEKSDLSEDELRKSVEQLEELVATGDRKGELLAKAQSGELEGEERDELYRLLGGGDDDDGFAAEITKSLQPESDEGLAKALDISDYLNAQHRGLVESMETVGELIEKGETRQHEFNLVLAKGLIDQSKLVLETHSLIKGISQRLGIIEQQPARPPKSQLTKSDVARREIAGQPEGGGGQGDQITKSEVANVLSGWIEQGRKTSGTGESLLHASSKFEQFNTLSPALAAEVKQALEAKRNGAAS